MTAPTLTPAQRAALEWLPENDWTADFTIEVGQQIIGLLQLKLIKRRWLGNSNGHWQWKLTPLGEALRKELNDA